MMTDQERRRRPGEGGVKRAQVDMEQNNGEPTTGRSVREDARPPWEGRPTILFLELAERTSGKGTVYLSGFCGKAKLVGFRAKEPDKYGNPVWRSLRSGAGPARGTPGGRAMNALAAAIGYIGRGWSPVPIPYRQKGPRLKSWPALRITAEKAPQWFNGKAENIGIILGSASGGLADTDLDCAEALALATDYLPPTESIAGRSSKPRSHFFYTSLIGKPLDLIDPENGETLVELRGGAGLQTLVPPSVHPSGEIVEWQDDGDPAQVDPARLVTAVKELGAACLILRRMPDKGRHGTLMAVSGWLLRNGRAAKQVRRLLAPVAREAITDRDGQAELERMLNVERGICPGSAGWSSSSARSRPGRSPRGWTCRPRTRRRGSTKNGRRLIGPF